MAPSTTETNIEKLLEGLDLVEPSEVVRLVTDRRRGLQAELVQLRIARVAGDADNKDREDRLNKVNDELKAFADKAQKNEKGDS